LAGGGGEFGGDGAAFGAAVLLAGCGNRTVLLSVDALSFTAPADRVLAFGPVPPLPVPVATGEVPVFDDLHVKLLGGTKDIVDVQDVTLSFSADLADSTGSGLDTLLASQSIGGHSYHRDEILIDHEFVDVLTDVDGIVHLDLSKFHDALPINARSVAAS